MKKLIICIFVALSLVGCQPSTGETNAVVGVGQIEVSKLFTYDGCTVYRFLDYGDFRYFTNCGGQSQTSCSENCGKNCTRHMDVRTTNSVDILK